MRLFEVEFFFSVSFGSLFFKGDEVFLLRPSYSRLAFARFQSSHQSAHVSFYLSLFLKLSPDPIGEEPTGVQRVRCLAGNGIEQKSIIDNSAFRLFPLSPPPPLPSSTPGGVAATNLDQTGWSLHSSETRSMWTPLVSCILFLGREKRKV